MVTEPFPNLRVWCWGSFPTMKSEPSSSIPTNSNLVPFFGSQIGKTNRLGRFGAELPTGFAGGTEGPEILPITKSNRVRKEKTAAMIRDLLFIS